LIEQPKNLAEKTNQKTRNYNLDLSSQRGHARISHSTICEVDEERLRQLGPSTDCHIVGNAEIYFYSCNGAPRVASGYL